jgi:hypothetical protein
LSDEANEFAAGVEFAAANAGVINGTGVEINWTVAGALAGVATPLGEELG